MAERIVFDRSLYLPEAIEAAVAAYAEHVQIEVTSTEDTVVAVLGDVAEHDPRTLAHTFCNHVLHETIALRRQTALDQVP